MTSTMRTQAPVVQWPGRPPLQAGEGGSTPTLALHLRDLCVQPVAPAAAKPIVERRHYLHSMPGGTCLAFGVFVNSRLFGAVTLGSGPAHAYRLVDGAARDDCLALTRLWLDDALPPNSESRVLGIVTRALRRHTAVKFLVSYADPSAGHVGTIYQAAGWIYTGLSEAMPLLDLGDGVPRHSRSLSHSFGSHSVEHFARHGVKIHLVPQSAKHRYVLLLDPALRNRLAVPVLPYPKEVELDANR